MDSYLLSLKFLEYGQCYFCRSGQNFHLNDVNFQFFFTCNFELLHNSDVLKYYMKIIGALIFKVRVYAVEVQEDLIN